MVLRKMWVLGNFGSDIGSVLMGLEVLFFLKFLLLGVLNVFADAPLGVSDLSFYLSIWSSGVNFSGFMGTAYGTELVDYKTVKQDRKPLHCSVVATFNLIDKDGVFYFALLSVALYLGPRVTENE